MQCYIQFYNHFDKKRNIVIEKPTALYFMWYIMHLYLLRVTVQSYI